MLAAVATAEAEAAARVTALEAAVAARDAVLTLYAAGRTEEARRAHSALSSVVASTAAAAATATEVLHEAYSIDVMAQRAGTPGGRAAATAFCDTVRRQGWAVVTLPVGWALNNKTTAMHDAVRELFELPQGAPRAKTQPNPLPLRSSPHNRPPW